MEQEPGNPLAYVVVVLIGFAALAIALALSSGWAMEVANEQGRLAREAAVAAAIQSWAKLLVGCGLIMFGFARQQPAPLRGGALIAGALLVAS